MKSGRHRCQLVPLISAVMGCMKTAGASKIMSCAPLSLRAFSERKAAVLSAALSLPLMTIPRMPQRRSALTPTSNDDRLESRLAVAVRFAVLGLPQQQLVPKRDHSSSAIRADPCYPRS